MQKYGLESKRLNDDHVPARGVFRRPKVQGNTIGIKVPHQHQSIAWSKHYPVGRSSEYSGGKVRHTPVPKGVSGLQKGLKGQQPPESDRLFLEFVHQQAQPGEDGLIGLQLHC